MMIKHLKDRFLEAVFLLLSFLFACSGDDPMPPAPVGSVGYFIVNEGGYEKGNTSISFFDRTMGTISNNVFLAANGVPLGDQAQSMAVHDGKGFIVVQNSGKIEVIDTDNFTTIATISENIMSPRYFVGLSATKGYLSDWGDDRVTGTVKVLDLINYSVIQTISAGQGTDKLFLDGEILYAVNAGGFGRDSTVIAINTNTDKIINTFIVGDNPNSLQKDKEGNIWIATSGHTQYNDKWEVLAEQSTTASIVKLNSSGKELMKLTFDGIGESVAHLNINTDGNQLYYLHSGVVYRMSTSATSLPTSKFIDKRLYGLAVDPIDNTLIGCEAPDFSASGNIIIYDAEGNQISTTVVGIAPNSCAFK